MQGTIQFSLGILAEAGLSYVGLGAQPPTPSWGRMLAESQTMIAFAPWLALVPGLAIVLTVLGLNLMGDGLRDLLDPPRCAGGRGREPARDRGACSLAHPRPADPARGVDGRSGPARSLGVIGESGSGKSMTALSVMGLLPAGSASRPGASGSTATDLLRARRGGDVRGPRPRDRHDLPGADDGAEPAADDRRPGRRDGARPWRRAAGPRRGASPRATLDRVGLPAERSSRSARYPHELSGGQRQRVVIAMAIALRPKLLIADEPTTALDVTTQAQILALLRRLVDEDGMGLMLITHDLAVVAEIADRLADHAPRRGGGDGPDRARCCARCAHPYTRGAARRLGASSRSGRARLGRSPLLEVEGPRARLSGRAAAAVRAAGESFPAVDGVSFTLHRGESLGLVGESGCGKSTLIRAILGLEPLQGGSVRVEGEVVRGRRARCRRRCARKMQAVFQDPYGSFNPRHRVARLVAEPFHLAARRRRTATDADGGGGAGAA